MTWQLVIVFFLVAGYFFLVGAWTISIHNDHKIKKLESRINKYENQIKSKGVRWNWPNAPKY